MEADILHEECRVRFSSFNIQYITGKNVSFDTAIFSWPPCTQAACGWVWCVSVSTALLHEGRGGSRVNDTHNTLTPALDCTHMKGSMLTDLCKHTHTHPHTQHSLGGHVASKPTHPTATLLTSSLGHPLIKPSTLPMLTHTTSPELLQPFWTRQSVMSSCVKGGHTQIKGMCRSLLHE